MQQKVQLTIMSHLSDIQHSDNLKTISHTTNFVKFLLSRYPNTLEPHDPEADYEAFKNKFPNA